MFFLDEVHLSEPFRQTLEAISGHFRAAEGGLPERWQAVEMSATPGEPREQPLRLEGPDRMHGVLRQRLQARRPATLQKVKVSGNPEKRTKTFARAAARAALDLVGPDHRTVAVVVNRVGTARAVRAEIDKERGIDALLLTGRVRPFDRDDLIRDWRDRLCSGRKRSADDRPLVVVATQCVEAGADFDFDGLVTECASLDALRQRFGRVDRLGELSRSGAPARGVVLLRSDSLGKKATDPVYGDRLAQTWAWLQSLPELDFGLEALPSPREDLSAPRPRAPVLMPAHLDLWCQTRPSPETDPEPALWLHGPDRGAPEVQIVWRAELDAALLQSDAEAAIVAVGTCPPGTGEALSVPLWAARSWLAEHEVEDISDVEGARVPDTSEHEVRPAVVWRGDDSLVLRDPAKLRPGDTLVVPCGYGGLAAGTWAPEATEPVVDLGERAQREQRARLVLRLHPAIVGTDTTPVPGVLPADDEETTEEDQIRAFLEGLPSEAIVDQLLESWSRVQHTPVPSDKERGWWVLSLQLPRDAWEPEFSSADDSASFTAEEGDLSAHLEGVGRLARALATGCGLPQHLVEAVALAGELHDLGKADPRFQRMLCGGSEIDAALRRAEGRLLAKSSTPPWDQTRRELARRASGLPRGMRHELGSIALVSGVISEMAGDRLGGNDELADLVLHLVASHHGWCRPFPPAVPDDHSLPMTVDHMGHRLEASTDHGLTRLDRGIPERFWRLTRRYGWWGLAWLESMLRLADHRQSALESRGGAR